MIGDLNNGDQERDRERGGKEFVGPKDFETLTEKTGLEDLWRLTHGDDTREYSWRSGKAKVSGSTMPSPIKPVSGECGLNAITTIRHGVSLTANTR
jgi:hypothetical protein